MKILLCDDHALFREGLRHVLSELAQDLELVETGTCAEALEVAAESTDGDGRFDLVLLDLSLPDTDGLNALKRFRKEHDGTPVVIVSASEEPADVRAAIDGGAAGFIPKSSSGSVLRGALELVLKGNVYVPPLMLRPEAAAAVAKDDHRRERAASLTPRQLEVLNLMSRGLTNPEIASVLGIAEGTVKAHLTAIFEALEVSNRTEAAIAKKELGLRAPGEEE